MKSAPAKLSSKVPRAGILTIVAVLTAGLAPAQAPSHVPDFNGVWGRLGKNYPKPYDADRGAGIKDGYNNEYLKPWVVEALMRDDLVTRSGRAIVSAHSICYPEGIPYAFGGSIIQILQTPAEITMLFGDQGQWRTIALNRPHSARVVPSWYGESVGHFEGDSLVVDTVGIAVHPQAGSMGLYGTPHTEALHVVERYRFLANGEKMIGREPPDRITDMGQAFDKSDVVPGGKKLRLTFTQEDPGAYRKPWSVTLDYLPLKLSVREYACAENSREEDLSPLIPTAAVPDF